ncbi:MAG: hypothetical protein GY940_02260, partial [bacterium]|nr:hypothetical protein [bacterium]
YIEIEELEENHKKMLLDVSNFHENLALFFPTTFYDLVSTNVGSLGYGNYMGFYGHLQSTRRQLLLHWIDGYYYNPPKKGIRIFIKGDDVIFKGTSRQPDNFSMGVIIQLVWILFFAILSSFLLKRPVVELRKKNVEKLGARTFKFGKGEPLDFYVKGDTLGNLFNLALQGHTHQLGEMGVPGSLELNGIDIIKEKNKGTVFPYLGWDRFPPDIVTGDLVRLIAGFARMPKGEVTALLGRPELQETALKTFGELALKKEDEDDEELTETLLVQQLEVIVALVEVSPASVMLLNKPITHHPFSCSVRLKQCIDGLKEKVAVVVMVSSSQLKDVSMMEGNLFVEGAWYLKVGAEMRR